LKKNNFDMNIPASTYRVQLHAAFTFTQLEDILDYLHELGIGAIYASPITQAVTGSQHGYDVSAPEALNPEIGTEGGLERISFRLREKGMMWLQDIVPNHMAFDSSNPWLYDVLERGTASAYHSFFDIDTSLCREIDPDKVMAPFLGKTLAESLKENEIRAGFSGDGFAIYYYDTSYPVASSAYDWICSVTDGCPSGLARSLQDLGEKSASSMSEWTAAKQRWLEEVAEQPSWSGYIWQCLDFINAHPGTLNDLLSRQHYQLADAQSASVKINYRRFFAVNSLISLRMEEEPVFSAWHRKLLEWHGKGFIQGLRIDHIDGLAAPGHYIHRLRDAFGKNIFIVAEKITAAGEQMPPEWALDGMTGYEFLALANQLFTDAGGFTRLKDFYLERISPETPAYEDLVFEKKYHFLKNHMGGELNNLVELLYALNLPGSRPVERQRLKEALMILMASFPVYRLYPETAPLPEASRRWLDIALKKAGERGAGYHQELQQLETYIGDLRFFRRLAQFTGPLAAKGIEDTSFYIYNALISRNEVGDSPARPGMTASDFHRQMTERLRILPHSLNAGTTHDTKRGEDSRIRLNCLTRAPEEWIRAVSTWRILNARFIYTDNGRQMPGPNDEYFIYQSLLGAFPADLTVTDAFRERFHAFLTKALREAGTNTTYVRPDETYESKCHAFVDAILTQGSAFLESFLPFAGLIIEGAAGFSLAQLLLRLTAPGIPDIYQGAECWDLSLVDPDNRLPVDFGLRKDLLKCIKEEEKNGWAQLRQFILANGQRGAGKLFVLYKTLNYRRRFPDLFSTGDYIPINAPDDLLVFLRHQDGNWALVVIPLIRKESNRSTPVYCQLPANAPKLWINIFTGTICRQADRGLEISRPTGEFPAVLLTGHE
jgi:(1->4)-alpha-D-glucan 1-alpha-D-glucosylmutase